MTCFSAWTLLPGSKKRQLICRRRCFAHNTHRQTMAFQLRFSICSCAILSAPYFLYFLFQYMLIFRFFPLNFFFRFLQALYSLSQKPECATVIFTGSQSAFRCCLVDFFLPLFSFFFFAQHCCFCYSSSHSLSHVPSWRLHNCRKFS